ncbi:hypothetical protein LCGC14_0464850 [marine sediment metagenome]|uniref:Rubredoxin-like domain-containing protein n=1 Tax=marine sediment metagenome TaxID=412755 RepID=A0A0F9VMW3_9ZZZZ
MNTIKLKAFDCLRCKWEWIPRTKERSRVCPKCKSPYWDIKRNRLDKRGKSIVNKRKW